MISLKPGVRIGNPDLAMAIAVMTAYSIYHRYGVPLVLTSIMDGRHSVGSLHYVGHAVDFRIRNFKRPEQVKAAHKELREALGEDFDVVLESDHIHLEYQPKRPLTK